MWPAGQADACDRHVLHRLGCQTKPVSRLLCVIIHVQQGDSAHQLSNLESRFWMATCLAETASTFSAV